MVRVTLSDIVSTRIDKIYRQIFRLQDGCTLV